MTASVKGKLESVGLADFDIENCGTSRQYKEKIADLVLQYEDMFSHHHLHCVKLRTLCIVFVSQETDLPEVPIDACPQFSTRSCEMC